MEIFHISKIASELKHDNFLLLSDTQSNNFKYYIWNLLNTVILTIYSGFSDIKFNTRPRAKQIMCKNFSCCHCQNMIKKIVLKPFLSTE